MEQPLFNSIWEELVSPELSNIWSAKGTSFKTVIRENEWQTFAYRSYCNGNSSIKNNYMVTRDLLDRHKVAALFYAALVENIDGRCPLYCVTETIETLRQLERSRHLDTMAKLYLHGMAFRVALDIVKSWALTDIHTEPTLISHQEFLKVNRFIQPKRICHDDGPSDYYTQTICQLFHASQYGALSPLPIANIFFSIENNSRLSFALQNK